MAHRYTLIYFNGCPSLPNAEKLLQSAGLNYELVCQDTLPSNDERLLYSSPTLLYGTQIVFGSEVPRGSKSCSWKLPSLQDLQQRLGQLLLNTKD